MILQHQQGTLEDKKPLKQRDNPGTTTTAAAATKQTTLSG